MADALDRLKAALADRYAIERELGSGGMATVYLAQDLRHERQVAVKVLRPELAAALGPDRFHQEIKIAANLHHPHILPLYDSGDADGFLYYVMPYEEGLSLRDKLAREGELPIPEAARILRDVVDALTHAHKHKVVHRDIKPDNVLLSENHALVTDFGVAKAVSEATGAQRLTTEGLALGTPAYMAPEQAAADKHIDHRADIYAVGALAYELLTGRPPFTGTTPQEVLAAHVTRAADPVTQHRQTVPPQLAQLVMRCLEKKPADRWQTAEELLPHLETLATPSGGMTPTDMQPAAERRPRLTVRSVVLGAAAAGIVVVVIVGTLLWPRADRIAPAESSPDHTSIAVLPFQNLSAEEQYGFFAGGLHEELRTQLAKVAALTVMGRTSVMAYAGTSKPLSEIAGDLEVGSILEGTVQVLGERLRVNVQLLDATTGANLWADRYDRTLDDAFAIQSEIAQQIVAAVGTALGTSELQALAEEPTANPEAYRLYLQGQVYQRRRGDQRRNLEAAQELYERAITLDSGFALAHAALSQVHGDLSWFRYDPSPERLERQQEEAELALRLAPDLPQAHLAMGSVYYIGRRDWQAALDEYRIARQGLPNDVDVLARIGYTHRRLGNWDQVLEAFERVSRLDPQNSEYIGDLGGHTLIELKRYPEAAAAYRRALLVTPDVGEFRHALGLTYINWKGEVDTLRVALADLPPDADLGSMGTARWWRAFLLMWERRPDSALELLESTDEAVLQGMHNFVPTSLAAAWAHALRGDTAAARASFHSARVLLDSLIGELPDDWRVHAALGYALAGLGHREEALSEARWLERSEPYRADALTGKLVAQDRALLLALAGEVEAALTELEPLLAGPSFTSSHYVDLDPRWDSIRDDPRLEALLERYRN